MRGAERVPAPEEGNDMVTKYLLEQNRRQEQYAPIASHKSKWNFQNIKEIPSLQNCEGWRRSCKLWSMQKRKTLFSLKQVNRSEDRCSTAKGDMTGTMQSKRRCYFQYLNLSNRRSMTTLPKSFLGREFKKSKSLTKEDLETKALLDSMIKKSADNGDDSVIRRWNFCKNAYRHHNNDNGNNNNTIWRK